MGNHEYCENCGASDFHRGYPCDPERVQRMNAERAKREESRIRSVGRLKGIQAVLKNDYNVSSRLNEYTCELVIHGLDIPE